MAKGQDDGGAPPKPSDRRPAKIPLAEKVARLERERDRLRQDVRAARDAETGAPGYSASCRHCHQVVVTDAPYLRDEHYTAMRAHLKASCPKLSVDLTAASVGELLKQYDVARG